MFTVNEELTTAFQNTIKRAYFAGAKELAENLYTEILDFKCKAYDMENDELVTFLNKAQKLVANSLIDLRSEGVVITFEDVL